MSEDGSKAFFCPECGCPEASQRIKHHPDPMPSAYDVTENPWLGVLEELVCAGCGFHIPTYLGELWDQLTPACALTEWHRYYRAGAKKEPSPKRNGTEKP